MPDFSVQRCGISADCAKRYEELGKAQSDLSLALDVLEDVLYQACHTRERGDGWMDSMALSANAEGLRLLALHGRVEIESEYGRRVIARLKGGA
jgi:hypothetical protein